MIVLYRNSIYLPEKSESLGWEVFELGPLRARWWGIPVPVALVFFLRSFWK